MTRYVAKLPSIFLVGGSLAFKYKAKLGNSRAGFRSQISPTQLYDRVSMGVL